MFTSISKEVEEYSPRNKCSIIKQDSCLLATSSSSSSIPGVVSATGAPDSGNLIAANALDTAAAALEPLGAATPAFLIVAEQLRTAVARNN